MKRLLSATLFGLLLLTPALQAQISAQVTVQNPAQTKDIFDAARANDVKTIQTLIDEKVNINQTDDRGYTALILATYNQSPEAAELLLQHGASTEVGDPTGRTALMGAAFQGDDQCIRLLLKYGAKVDATDVNGATALMYAVEFGRKAAIKALIAGHADPSWKDKRGFDAFYLAQQEGDPEVLALLKPASDR